MKTLTAASARGSHLTGAEVVEEVELDAETEEGSSGWPFSSRKESSLSPAVALGEEEAVEVTAAGTAVGKAWWGGTGRPVSAGRQRAPTAAKRKMVEATSRVAAASGRSRVRPRGAIGQPGSWLDCRRRRRRRRWREEHGRVGVADGSDSVGVGLEEGRGEE